MTLIKLMLLAAIVVTAVLAFRGGGTAFHKVLWRAYVVMVVVTAGLSVLFPDVLTSVARMVGVGRGADLVLYGLVVMFMMVSVVLFRRLEDVERRYTQLARAVAIRDARAPSGLSGSREG